ncbi:MAG: mechanosensitive ion channel family protein [Oscillospiraceae bacterium]|nr:mechanosensitive ion channel family protein [Oscillospiraceae bacterium]
MDALTPQESFPQEIKDAVNQIVQQPFEFERLIRLTLTLFMCIVVMRVLLALLNRVIVRLKVERSLHTLIRSGSKILLWFITVLILAESLGFPISSLLGILGIIGLAISMAIQGTLSNLAGGIMILGSKPFVVGDYIEAGGVEGTVHDIGMVYTRIQTVDNKLIFVPNGEISGEKIVNYTSQTTRRVDLKFQLSYNSGVDAVKTCIRGVIDTHPQIQGDPAPFVRVSAYLDNSIEYTVRVWCATADYWTVYADLLEQVKAALDREKLEMTYPHMIVHMEK